MDKRSGEVILKGIVLPDTEDPDLDGDIFNLEGVQWVDAPLPLHWDIYGGQIGTIRLERTPEGIMGEAMTQEDRRLNAVAPEIAFGIEGYVGESKRLLDGTRCILEATITGVSVLPEKLAITKGTRASVSYSKPDAKAHSFNRGMKHP